MIVLRMSGEKNSTYSLADYASLLAFLSLSLLTIGFLRVNLKIRWKELHSAACVPLKKNNNNT